VTPPPAVQPPAPSATRPTPDDVGSAAVELVLLAPLLIVLLLFVVAVGRLTTAHLTLDDAAAQAARTLTVIRDPATARTQARATATTAASGLNCRPLTVTLDRPPLGAGTGPVPAVVLATARLSCTVSLADLTGLGLPSTTVLTTTATSPIDRYLATP
jgi:Flp pilus assembly protein TadG